MQLRIAAVTTVLFWGIALFAQDSGIDIGLHANSKAGAAEIGLPVYPGATPYKDKDNDSAANLGLNFGDFHFKLLVAEYKTGDSPAQVFAFYRKPLSRYGEVLECDHGQPVGALKVTRTGLTCSDKKGGNIEVNGGPDSSKDHELRVGSPHKFRIVGIDDAQNGPTRFGLVYLELPKDSDDGKTD